jgi:hypothetical protein
MNPMETIARVIIGLGLIITIMGGYFFPCLKTGSGQFAPSRGHNNQKRQFYLLLSRSYLYNYQYCSFNYIKPVCTQVV